MASSQADPLTVYSGPDCHCCNKPGVRYRAEEGALVCTACDLSGLAPLPPVPEQPPPAP